jgi:pyrrolidone-carboxylate peptidase
MNKTLVTAFGDFLEYDFNSTKKFLNEIPDKNGLIKMILPVGYFKNEFVKPVKKYRPKRIIFLGMENSAKNPKFETIAKNEMKTLKNPFYRFVGTAYSYYLKWNNKNLRIKKSFSKKTLSRLLTVIPIQKDKPKQITLHSNPPKLKQIKISKYAGNYVCNYSMWVTENYIKEHNLPIEFFFIHIPPKLNKAQKQELFNFIFK